MFFVFFATGCFAVAWILTLLPLKEEIRLLAFFRCIVSLNRYVLGTQVNITCRDAKIPQKVLVLPNHSGVLDFVYCLSFHYQRFPHHKAVFVMKKEVGKLPVIGPYVYRHHIPVSRIDPETDRESLRTRIEAMCQPYVIYLFCEGTSFCRETHEKYGKPYGYKNTLRPRSGGVFILKDHVQEVWDMTLLYEGEGKGQYELDLLWGNYPARVQVCAKKIPANYFSDDYAETKTLLESWWREKDETLSQYYRALPPYDQSFCERQNIPKSWIFLFSTLFLAVHIPLTWWMYGWMTSGLALCLVGTSLEYHVWGRHQALDALIALSNFVWFLTMFRTDVARLMLVLGSVSYVASKTCGNGSMVSHALHFLLHLYAYVSVLVELSLHRERKRVS